MALLALLVAGCSSAPPSPPTDEATGLPILAELPPFAGSTAATAWNDSESTPEGFGPDDAVHADLGGLIAALHNLGQEQDMRFTMGFLGDPAPDAATLVIHATGRGDDAIIGDEVVMKVHRNERGWYVDSVRHRMHCRRGIDPETEFCG
jgi:hypothetical protein